MRLLGAVALVAATGATHLAGANETHTGSPRVASARVSGPDGTAGTGAARVHACPKVRAAGTVGEAVGGAGEARAYTCE
ncbi:MAG TPA: hypothetical protein VFI47_00575 [Acidimicrobiales bacterium]|nr:hypothetical protein [Acidimicrobiales bacterium]